MEVGGRGKSERLSMLVCEQWARKWESEMREGQLPVKSAGAVEELQVEGAGGLAVDLSIGACLHGRG